MSTLRVNTIQDTAGSGSPAINGLAKAWVNFNGTNTVAIRASMNVSSITDITTGAYTINFTNAMADANYSAAITVRRSGTNDVLFGNPYGVSSGTAYATTGLLRSPGQRP